MNIIYNVTKLQSSRYDSKLDVLVQKIKVKRMILIDIFCKINLIPYMFTLHERGKITFIFINIRLLGNSGLSGRLRPGEGI